MTNEYWDIPGDNIKLSWAINCATERMGQEEVTLKFDELVNFYLNYFDHKKKEIIKSRMNATEKDKALVRIKKNTWTKVSDNQHVEKSNEE